MLRQTEPSKVDIWVVKHDDNNHADISTLFQNHSHTSGFTAQTLSLQDFIRRRMFLARYRQTMEKRLNVVERGVGKYCHSTSNVWSSLNYWPNEVLQCLKKSPIKVEPTKSCGLIQHCLFDSLVRTQWSPQATSTLAGSCRHAVATKIKKGVYMYTF